MSQPHDITPSFIQPTKTQGNTKPWLPTKVFPLLLPHIRATNPPQVEHNIPPQTSTTGADQPPRPRRPDLSTFFTTLEYTDTSRAQNPNILPIPQNVSATFRTAANAYIFLRENVGREGEGGLLAELIEVLMGEAVGPPRVVEGVGDEFLAGEFFLSIRSYS